MKIYFLKTYSGTVNEYTHTALKRVVPDFDNPLNDKKSVIVYHSHPKHTGTLVHNLSRGMWDNSKMAVDNRCYVELPERIMTRVDRSRLLELEYDGDIDIFPENEHYNHNPYYN